ncbi:DEAD/DEAH box helicase [Marinobacterium jannaschii]
MIELTASIKIYVDDELRLDELRSQLTYFNPLWASAMKAGKRPASDQPQYISAFRQHDDCFEVPAGMAAAVARMFPELVIQDLRGRHSVSIPELSAVCLRDYQTPAVESAAKVEQATLVAPTGAGKTIIGLSVLQRWGERALVLVHNRELANQWCEEIRKLVGVEPGFIGGGKWREGEQITVAMLQTLSRNPQRAAELNYGALLVDEAHHIPSQSFAAVSSSLNVGHRLGLTATPERRDGLGALIEHHLGPICHRIEADAVRSLGGIVPVVVRPLQFEMDFPPMDSWAEYLDQITASPERNQWLATLAARAAEKNPTLLLTDRTEHAELLGQLLPEALVLYGSLSVAERRRRFEQIDQARLVIGTTGLLGEGLDIKGLTNLILATPISSETRLLQAVGRVIRSREGKGRCFVADVFEPCGFSISSHRKRLAIYQQQGWQLHGG